MIFEKIKDYISKNFVIIDEELWPKLQSKMLLENIFKVRTTSLMALVMMLFILFLDYQRYLNGEIVYGKIYWYLFLSHFSILLILIPLLLINRNKRKIRSGTYKHGRALVILWLVIVAIVLLIMAALSVLDRGSVLVYALYIVVINFVLTLFHPDRVMLNLVSFITFSIMIFIVYPHLDASYFVYVLEAFAITIVAFALSTRIYNMEVKVVSSEANLVSKNVQLEKSQAESNRLLLNILPETVAAELIEKGSVQPRNYKSTTVMMIDFVGFSKISKEMSSEDLVKTLDYNFTHFDRVIKKYGIEKIKTIGDGYLCVGGIPTESDNHSEQTLMAALDILSFLEKEKAEKELNNEPYFQGRIGIHTGPLTAGVVGETKFAYDIWGDTVNIAARLEASGKPGEINISKATWSLVKDQFECENRGNLPIKNLGSIDMYFVRKKRP